MKTYSIAWWNLENLFDVENSPARTDKLQRTLRRELNGWNETILERKINQLASIIVQINDGRGPDLLGVCEVENRVVLDRLVHHLDIPGREYLVAHHDMSDARGIDVAFIYDRQILLAGDQFSHTIIKRTATRDLFQVNFTTEAGRLLVVIGNHWPARTAGVYESEPYRMLAGETLSYFCDRIEEIHGDSTPILVMGDFNDEPSNRSLTEYALADRNRTKVVYASSPRLFNLMWPMMAQGVGTYYHNNEPNMLDQFLINGGALKSKSKIRPLENSACILQFPGMASGGRYATPVRFGRPSSGLNLDGYSDHFPIAMSLQEI